MYTVGVSLEPGSLPFASDGFRAGSVTQSWPIGHDGSLLRTWFE